MKGVALSNNWTEEVHTVHNDLVHVCQSCKILRNTSCISEGQMKMSYKK